MGKLKSITQKEIESMGLKKKFDWYEYEVNGDIKRIDIPVDNPFISKESILACIFQSGFEECQRQLRTLLNAAELQ